MGAAVGHEVVELVRVRIGRLDLGELAPGRVAGARAERGGEPRVDGAPGSRQ